MKDFATFIQIIDTHLTKHSGLHTPIQELTLHPDLFESVLVDVCRNIKYNHTINYTKANEFSVYGVTIKRGEK